MYIQRHGKQLIIFFNSSGKISVHYFLLAFLFSFGHGLVIFIVGSQWRLGRRSFAGAWAGGLTGELRGVGAVVPGPAADMRACNVEPGF